MTIDLAGFRADTDFLLTEWGETATIHRISIDYDTVPPTETWSAAGTVSIEIQPISGSMFRGDPGLIGMADHWGITAYDAGLLTNDRIIRIGETDYYLVTRVDQLEDHLEVWMRRVEGAV